MVEEHRAAESVSGPAEAKESGAVTAAEGSPVWRRRMTFTESGPDGTDSDFGLGGDRFQELIAERQRLRRRLSSSFGEEGKDEDWGLSDEQLKALAQQHHQRPDDDGVLQELPSLVLERVESTEKAVSVPERVLGPLPEHAASTQGDAGRPHDGPQLTSMGNFLNSSFSSLPQEASPGRTPGNTSFTKALEEPQAAYHQMPETSSPAGGLLYQPAASRTRSRLGTFDDGLPVLHLDLDASRHLMQRDTCLARAQLCLVALFSGR